MSFSSLRAFQACKQRHCIHVSAVKPRRTVRVCPAAAARRVLVINSGSSSLKFHLYNLVGGALSPNVSGLLERIGDTANSVVTISGLDAGQLSAKVPLADHKQGLQHTFHILQEHVSSSIADEVAAIGHRVVHGGHLTSSVLLDPESRKGVQLVRQCAPRPTVSCAAPASPADAQP
jgi:acetate kinase